LYYRVNPSNAISPLQILTNTVSTTYDSLLGNFGNQNSPQLLNTENTSPNNTGRARIYTAIDANATVQMLPLQTQPKLIVSTSNNTSLGGTPQEVVVGEEILYELVAQIPVANLRNFMIRDELPAGLTCVDIQPIDLTNDSPYSSAGFMPGGTPVMQCDGNVVQWDFGDQELTMGVFGTLFTFTARFTARCV